jgi:hypothetical protein
VTVFTQQTTIVFYLEYGGLELTVTGTLEDVLGSINIFYKENAQSLEGSSVFQGFKKLSENRYLFLASTGYYPPRPLIEISRSPFAKGYVSARERRIATVTNSELRIGQR